MSFPELQTNIHNHMYAVAKRYQNEIDAWEINEQNMPWANALDLTWDQKIESYHSAIEGVHDGNPHAQIIFTSTALPYEFGIQKPQNTAERAGGMPFPEFLDLVISDGVNIDAIGLEFYYSGVNTDGYAPPGLSLASQSRLLDLYARYNRPIIVRELSAPSAQHPRSNWWHTTWNEQIQAEFVEKFYTIAFSKPLVRGISWSYGVSDEDAFIQSGGLLNADLTPKPAFYALKTLIESWTTSGRGETDTDGKLLLHGFAGDYEITVTTPQGISWNTRAHVYEQEANELTINFLSE
jgi:endo-1,4-beta-xylanase